MFSGSLVALLTPFHSNGAVDLPALRALVKRHLNSGTHALVVAGTTGEAPTLTDDEWGQVVAAVVEESNGSLPVIAGCGANDTRHAVELHSRATAMGADAALHVTGYYNRPDQRGLLAHYREVASTSDLPILVYHIPQRTQVVIAHETMIELSQLPTVVGVKDSTQDMKRPVLESLQAEPPFALLTGEDASAVAYNAAGGVGCISVTANIAPGLCAEMQQLCLDGDFLRARELQSRLMPLHQALFLEPSPAGAKYAASRLGWCLNRLRLPIAPVSASTEARIDAALLSLGLLQDEQVVPA